jgi:hypothetical protein
MSAETRRFDLADVLTVTTGRLLCPIGHVYAILNYLTGDNLFTHQLPRAQASCQPALLEQHPALVGVAVPEIHDEAGAQAFVAAQARIFGATLAVTPLAWWVPRDPLAELADIAGDRPVIVIEHSP